MIKASFDPRLSRLVKVSFGFWLGLLLGPIVSYVLVLLPSNRWSGPYVERAADGAGAFAAGYGLPCGLLVGLVVAWFARGLQLLWRVGRGQAPSPQPSWAEAFRPDAAAESREIRLDQVTDPDARISRRTDVVEPPGEGG
jgi:hypothetical protein